MRNSLPVASCIAAEAMMLVPNMRLMPLRRDAALMVSPRRTPRVDRLSDCMGWDRAERVRDPGPCPRSPIPAFPS